MNLKHILKDFNPPAFSAGITAFTFMVFGALTLQISIVERFGLSDSAARSWIVVTWLVPGVISLFFILRYRQPLAIGWTIPGLVYMASLGGRFGFEELVTANLVAGAAIVVLGIAGIGGRLIRLIPQPILMSMFAASILNFVVGMVDAAPHSPALAVPMLAAYLAGRRLNRPSLPPVGLSFLAGAAAIAITGQWQTASLHAELPVLVMPGLAISPAALLSVSLPMVILVVGLGNAQGMGYLVGQGYRVPVNALTIAVGLMTMVHALFGGHPASAIRTSSAMLGGPSAGPIEKRYWAALVAFLLVTMTGLLSGLLLSLMAFVPREFLVLVAGLAILSSFEDALQKAFDGRLRLGSTVAFVVTLAGSLTLAGIPSAFWALVVGLGASLAVEGEELKQHWSPGAAPTQVQAAEPTRRIATLDRRVSA